MRYGYRKPHIHIKKVRRKNIPPHHNIIIKLY